MASQLGKRPGERLPDNPLWGRLISAVTDLVTAKDNANRWCGGRGERSELGFHWFWSRFPTPDMLPEVIRSRHDFRYDRCIDLNIILDDGDVITIYQIDVDVSPPRRVVEAYATSREAAAKLMLFGEAFIDEIKAQMA